MSGTSSSAVNFLASAFAAMGPHHSTSSGLMGKRLRGDRSRLLARCFTLSAQGGRAELVRLALQSRADVEQRINGQSALDGAAQTGQLQIARVLLDVKAAAEQTAPGRW